MPGERRTTNECEVCKFGSFSLDWESENCKECMNNVICMGGIEIDVEKGFWWKTLNST